jgi:hypothetical protein
MTVSLAATEDPAALMAWYLSASASQQDAFFRGDGVILPEKEITKEHVADPLVCSRCGPHDGYLVDDYRTGSVVCVACGLVASELLLDERDHFEEEADQHHAVFRTQYITKHHVSERLNAYLCEDPPLDPYVLELLELEIRDLDPGLAGLSDPRSAKLVVRRGLQRLVKRKVKGARMEQQEKWIQIRWGMTGQKPQAPWDWVQRLQERFTQFYQAWFWIKPAERKNVMNLNFVFRQLAAQAYGAEFMETTFPYFPLLKNKKKVKKLEEQMREICDFCDWTYFDATKDM